MALRGTKSPESDEIADSEDQAKPIDWESSDDINPVDDFYANRLKKAENDAVTDESDPDNIDDQEENPKLIPTRHVKKGKTRFDRIKRAIKRGGPTGGVIGVIVGTFGFSSVILGPSSLLVNLSTLLNNHTDLGNHLFLKSGKSYMKAVLTGQTRNCATSKIKCKFGTITEARKAEWEKRGIKVDVGDGKKNALGRYKVRGLEYKNKKVTSLYDYKSLRFTDPEFNSLLKRFPVRAGYLNAKSSINKSLVKFKPKLGVKFKSSKKSSKNERRAENSKKMNSQTGVKVDAKGKVTFASVKAKADTTVKKAIGPSIEKLKGLEKGLAVAGNVALPVVGACAAYNVIRAAQAAVIVYWHGELLAFAIPFLQAGAQAKEAGVSGGFDWETAEYFGDRLTQPVTQKDIDENPNLYSQNMLGKTMMDSKGIAAALNGDHASIKNNHAEKYTGWWPNVIGIGIVKDLQELADKDTLRTTCSAARVTTILGSIAGCATKLPACVLMLGSYIAVTEIWGDDILEFVIKELQDPAMEAIANANLSDSLHGPPGGEALAGASGVLASYMDRSSGYAVAGSNEQAYQAYNEMITDRDYQQDKIADVKLEASKDQFNPKNPYSFVGQFASRVSNVPWDGSLFSVMAGAINTVTHIPVTGTALAVKDGTYQPIEIYNSREQFNGTLENCESPGMQEIGVPCMGESGRAVPYILPDVQKCLDEEEQEGSNKVCINDAIDYLADKKYETNDEDEDGKKKKEPYINRDTGKPSDWSKYSGESGDNYDNPFLMFMRYCGNDRKYPLGYTDQTIETDKGDWHTGINCASDSSSVKKKDISDTDLAWMSYYYNMCIALLASEEDQDYCWEESSTAPISGGGDWVIPTSGPCTSPYGPRWGSLHAGIDIGPSEGTPIVAPTNMTITYAGFNSGGYGFMVTGKADDGSDYSFRFGHMFEQPPVSVGDKVSKGETIGKVGNTGDSQGAHLHFEVFPPGANPATFSGSVDPVPILNGKGASISC